MPDFRLTCRFFPLPLGAAYPKRLTPQSRPDAALLRAALPPVSRGCDVCATPAFPSNQANLFAFFIHFGQRFPWRWVRSEMVRGAGVKKIGGFILGRNLRAVRRDLGKERLRLRWLSGAERCVVVGKTYNVRELKGGSASP